MSATLSRRACIQLLAAAASASTLPGAFAADPIRIGAVLSPSGAASFLGEPQLKTLQLYIGRINAAGGVLGRQLQLVHYDDGSDANAANGFVKRLVEQDKVDAVIAGSTTGATLAMIPIVERAGVPFFALGAGVAIDEPPKKWVFKVAHSDRMAAEKVFDDLKRRGIRKVGLLSETSGYGQSGRTQTLLVAKNTGIELVADETYGLKDTDMTVQLTKIRNAPGVEAVFVFGLGQGPTIVTRNYAQLGIKQPMYLTHAVASQEYIRLAGPASEGVRLPAAAPVIADLLPESDPQRKVAMAYAADYAKATGAEVSQFGGYAYDALMMIVEAMKRAGSTDKARVRDEIEKTRGFVGQDGIFTYSPTNHGGLDATALRMVEVRSGRFVLVRHDAGSQR